MQLNVALDRVNQRDLTLNVGDQQTLSVTVYAHDGDTVPVAVTNPRIVTCPAASITIPVASQFTVPALCWGRTNYRLVAEVAGVTTTLAWGVLSAMGGYPYGWCGHWDYGGPWGYSW